MVGEAIQLSIDELRQLQQQFQAGQQAAQQDWAEVRAGCQQSRRDQADFRAGLCRVAGELSGVQGELKRVWNLLQTLVNEARSGTGIEGSNARMAGPAADDVASGPGKGDSPHLPERPSGCFAQMGTVPSSQPVNSAVLASALAQLELPHRDVAFPHNKQDY